MPIELMPWVETAPLVTSASVCALAWIPALLPPLVSTVPLTMWTYPFAEVP